MSQAFFTETARENLLEIFKYIAQDNPEAALRTVDQLETKCQLIAATPRMGRIREEFSKELLTFPVGNYLIFYRIMGEDIEIVRVYHTSRNPEKFMEP